MIQKAFSFNQSKSKFDAQN